MIEKITGRSSPARKVFAFNQFERDQWIVRQAEEIPEGFKVLDVGAGTCPYRTLFAHCDYKAHDFKQLEPDQLFGDTGYGKIDYVSDVLALPVEDDSFDVLLCTEVIEHVPEPIAALQEFARILKPGGILLLTAPLGSGIHQQPFHYYGGFTPYWYKKFLKEAGFEHLEVTPNGGFFKYYGQESMRFARFTMPWRIDSRLGWRLIWAPLWLLLLPWLGIAAPLLCHFLDGLEQDPKFTIGYHVKAKMKSKG